MHAHTAASHQAFRSRSCSPFLSAALSLMALESPLVVPVVVERNQGCRAMLGNFTNLRLRTLEQIYRHLLTLLLKVGELYSATRDPNKNNY